MSKLLNKQKTLRARCADLYIGNKWTGVSIQTDPDWPTMWRVRQGEQVSDMVNLSRAKDAAVAWARPRGLGGNEVATWRRRESGVAAPPMRQMEMSDAELG